VNRALVLPLCLIFCIAGLPFHARAQAPRPPAPADQRPPFEDEERHRLEKEMAKKANLQRQTDLKRDTEKLLKLATELKEYVDKTNENVLSLDVTKKAEEIEKLARSVKDKMKGNGALLP